MARFLTATLDEFQPGGTVRLPDALVRAFYVVSGTVNFDGPGVAASLPANAAIAAREALTTTARPAAQVIRWELGDRSNTATGDCTDVTSRLLLSAPIALDEAASYLLRCDRVDFPSGGEALLHTHQGGGIRCLLFGEIRIESGGNTDTYQPLEAWFESGSEPVYAATSQSGPSAFARLMFLPPDLKGKSSIRYVRDEDKSRPKSQSYQVFLDHPVSIS